MARPLSIRTRVVLGSLAVLVPAALFVEAGGWWLMRRSLIAAADSYLGARVEGVRGFIDHIAHEPSEGLEDELQEYVRLAAGDALLEVADRDGRVIAGPVDADLDRAVARRLTLRSAETGAPAFEAVTMGGRPFRVVGAEILAGGQRYAIVAALPVGQSQVALNRFAWVLFAATPIVLLFAGAAVYVAVRRSLAPVDRITSAARAITVRDLGRRLDVPEPDDELRRLTSTVNAMLARLETAVADLTRFTGDAAHELRTPVTLVRTTAEVALARDRDPAAYRDALREIVGHAEHMSTLVEDLLVLARADAGVEPRADEPVDLAELARDAVARMAPAFEQRSIGLGADTPSQPALVVANAREMARVLQILLENALRYTPAGTVAVRVSVTAADVTLAVVDTGIGIPPGETARVFDRFFRGARGRERAPEGAGLGLSIARALVERHGGTVAASAGERATGCTITVRFPAASPSPSPSHFM